MTDIRFTHIQSNGIRMRVAEAGSAGSPLVVLCHGFPESWYSWKAQLLALAAAGYHVVAPDMRGYGGTEAPHEISAYSIFHLVGDIIGLLDHHGVEKAAIAGHDWGAPVAWHCALFRPDRVRAVAGFSVPFFPRAPRKPSDAMPQDAHSRFYQLYFCEEGAAEAEFGADVAASMRDFAWLWSGEGGEMPSAARTMVPRNAGMLTGRNPQGKLPSFVSPADLQVYIDAFIQSGFRGPLNWYRNIDRNWEQTAPWAGARIHTPALYMVGANDMLAHLQAHGRADPQPGAVRARPAREDHLAQHGALDPARAAAGGDGGVAALVAGDGFLNFPFGLSLSKPAVCAAPSGPPCAPATGRRLTLWRLDFVTAPLRCSVLRPGAKTRFAPCERAAQTLAPSQFTKRACGAGRTTGNELSLRFPKQSAQNPRQNAHGQLSLLQHRTG
jgi:pimeloyl-ACP methyl ester carboxylesterase